VLREASEPQIGDLRLQIDQIELDAALPADTFAIREARADAKSGS
jgi:hypothetical protein